MKSRGVISSFSSLHCNGVDTGAPGFGPMKVTGLAAVLSRRLGVELAEPLAPSHPCLGDVDSPEALLDYQAAKRAHKAALRAAGTR